jgi:hypothetical protein
MTEYIITEEQLNSIDEGELRSYRKMLLDLVRSRPYQNQMEKVNQYIITEELWNRILHTLWDYQEVNLCVRIKEESRPYQKDCHQPCESEPLLDIERYSKNERAAEREKVLDELERWCKPEDNELDRHATKKGDCVHPSGRLLKKIAELRGER